MGQKYTKTFRLVQENAVTLKDLTWLTYDGFMKAIEELNIILDDLTSSEGNDFQLLFTVSSTDNSYLWKAFVRIACCKIKKSTNTIETEKMLDLPRFCKVYRNLTKRYRRRNSTEEGTHDDYATKVDFDVNQDLTISLILSSVDAVKAEPVEECCICMERKSDVSLACAHSYCKECIHQWCGEHDSCPICRNKVSSHEEFWEMSEIPTESEMANYVMGFSEASKDTS